MAVNSAILMVRRTSTSASSVRYIPCIGPSPHHDQAAPLASRTRRTCRILQQRVIGGNMVPKAFNWHVPAFVLFRFPPPQSFFDVLALEIRFLTAFQHWQRCNLCFCVPSSLLQPRHFFSFDQPKSYDLCCAHPPSTINFLRSSACLSTIRVSFFAA